jgi:hypothetical protein
MSKNLPGLKYDKATDAWSIDKRIKGHGRIRQRLTAKTPEDAEKQFFQTIAQIQGEVHRREEGIMTFQEATDRYLDETQNEALTETVIHCGLSRRILASYPWRMCTWVRCSGLSMTDEKRGSLAVRSSAICRSFCGC